jgi:predicted DNA binding CopG/RHH family protein
MGDGYARVPHRTVRIPDDEWEAAKAKAAAEGETLSEVIRRALRRYTAK